MDDNRKSWQNTDEIIQQLGLDAGSTVADLGCGPGYFTIPIVKAIGSGGKIFAVDEDPNMLEHLRKNVGRSLTPDQVSIVVHSEADVARTGITEGVVDLVFIANLVHDLPDVKAFFAEVHRMLKPRGRIVDIDWQKTETNEMGPPLERRLSEGQTRNLLRDNNFRIVYALNPGPYHYGLVCRAST